MPHEDTEDSGLRAYTVTVDSELSKKLNRPKGKYATVECRAVPEHGREKYGEIAARIADAIALFLPQGATEVLVVGLGNPSMTADSLGSETCARIAPTAEKPRLTTVVPSVVGVTGVESFDVVAGVASRTRPDAIIAIDSLASAAVSRIASAFQITDTGITPGSGVSNHRARMCADSLGVPVISLGVPLVVYASTIIEDATGSECPDDEVGNMIVTPKDIDVYVSDCADILASAVTTACGHAPTLRRIYT